MKINSNIMKAKKMHFILYILFFQLIFVACNTGNSKHDDFDYGTVDKGIYNNSYFRFSVKVPADWNTLTQEQNQNLMNKNTLGSNDPSKITTVILLTASQFEPGKTDSTFNSNMIILAENIKGNTRIRNGSDYLRLTRQALEKEPILRQYPDSNAPVMKIKGSDFSTMEVTTTDGNKTYSQKYYTILVNDFALTAILTYATEDERIVLENAFSTINFK